MLTLTIPRVLRSANVGRGAHWATRHQATKAWEQEMWIALLRTPGGRAWMLSPDGRERRRVTITRHTPRADHVDRMDPDNRIFAAKGVRDALKRLRLIVDDNARWLESTVVDAYTPDRAAHTTITIERLELLPDDHLDRPRPARRPTRRARLDA